MASSRKPRRMRITRPELETAIDELISNKRGYDFQRIAVPLARERCPVLATSELFKDGGEGAYLIAIQPGGKFLSMASSLRATIGKIRTDLSRIKQPRHLDLRSGIA